MPNNCYFQMKIAGPEQAVAEFVAMLQRRGPFQKDGLGRVFSFDPLVPDESFRDSETGYFAYIGEGDCANSILTSMKDGCGFPRTLESETKRLSLAVEYYSSEPGCAFQEHGVIVCGKVLEHECIHYHEHFVEDMNDAQIQALCEEKGLSREELMNSVNCNGEYCEGGYSNFGEFSDLFSFLTKVRNTAMSKPIDEQIKSAAIRNLKERPACHEKENTPEHDR